MAYEILPSKHVIKYLKKLKEKTLKEQFLTIIYDEIAVRPHSGEQKRVIYQEFGLLDSSMQVRHIALHMKLKIMQ